MIEMFDDPKRDFHSLVGEARDCLHTLNRLGGPEWTYYKISLLLREQTPRFEWNNEDTRRLILNGHCRFHEFGFNLRSKKQHARDLLNLDDIIRIRLAAAEKVAPLLEMVKKAGDIPPIPSDLVISNFAGPELNFTFFTAAASELAYDNPFNDHILRELERVTADYVAAKRAKDSGDPKP